jgi:hypothetical protein
MSVIDFQGKVNQEQQALEDLLQHRRQGIPGMIDQTRGELEGARGEALGANFQSKLAGLGISPAAGVGQTQQAQLGLGLDELLGNQEYQSQKERINLAYNHALGQALQAGKSKQEAEAYARQFQQDEISRQTRGGLAEKQRQQSQKAQGIQSSAIAQQQDLAYSQLPDPTAEYEQAMYRILGGMPSQMLTYYSLTRGGNQAQPGQTTEVKSQYGDGGVHNV